MNEKEQYQKKKQEQLDEWKAKLDKLKAQATQASADMRSKLNQQIEQLEPKIIEGKARLAELASASEEAWGSLKNGMESAWVSMRIAFKEAADKFKK